MDLSGPSLDLQSFAIEFSIVTFPTPIESPLLYGPLKHLSVSGDRGVIIPKSCFSLEDEAGSNYIIYANLDKIDVSFLILGTRGITTDGPSSHMKYEFKDLTIGRDYKIYRRAAGSMGKHPFIYINKETYNVQMEKRVGYDKSSKSRPDVSLRDRSSKDIMLAFIRALRTKVGRWGHDQIVPLGNYGVELVSDKAIQRVKDYIGV